MATLWDPSRVKANAYKCYAGIIISASIRGYDFPVNVLNLYAPYKSRISFWNRLFDSEMLDINNLLIVGDMNVVFKSNEV